MLQTGATLGATCRTHPACFVGVACHTTPEGGPAMRFIITAQPNPDANAPAAVAGFNEALFKAYMR